MFTQVPSFYSSIGVGYDSEASRDRQEIASKSN